MGGLQSSLAILASLALGLSACAAPNLTDLAKLPVRKGPQADLPRGDTDPGAALRGNAVAIAVVTP